MVLTGICGLIQAFLLPGIFESKLLGIQSEDPEWKKRLWIALPCLSLLTIFYLSWLVATFNLNPKYFWWPLFFIEVSSLLILERKKIKGLFSKRILLTLEYSLLIGIFACCFLLLFQIGTVFTHNDAILSFNNWALQWAQGQLPSITFHYPQIISSMWGLIYVFTSEPDLQFFPKISMLCIGALLILFSLSQGNRLTQRCIAVASIFTFFFAIADTVLFERSFWFQTADFSCAIFGFFGVMTCLEKIDNEYRYKILLTAALAISISALIKQSGLWLVFTTPFIFYFIHRRNEIKIGPKSLVRYFLTILLIVLPWYLFKHFQIRLGKDVSEVIHVTSENFGAGDILSRIPNALRLVVVSMGGPIGTALISFFLAIGLFFDRKCRILFFWIILPYTLIWTFFYSYDRRNLVLTFPFVIYIISAGILELCRYFKITLNKKIKINIPYSLVAVLFLTITVWGLFLLNRTRLHESQNLQHRRIGRPELNELIYKNIDSQKTTSILTNYRLMEYIPGLKEHYVWESFSEIELLKTNMEKLKPGYLLVDKYNRKEVLDELERMQKDGSIKLIFEFEDNRFYSFS